MKGMKLLLMAAMAIIGTNATAEESTKGDGNVAAADSDQRQLVNYPPELKAHTLANMRGHITALAQITDALSKGKFEEAADLADGRLGMASEAAAGCRNEDPHGMAAMMSRSAHLDHMMSQLMPEDMRKLGQNMHRSANEFASVAREAGKSGNGAAALAALGRVMEQCAACHARYRLN